VVHLTLLLQAIASGFATGCIYALIAAGLTLVFGVMRIINFAHGEFLMLGMYGGYFCWSLLGLDPIVAVFVVTPALAVLGALLFDGVIRWSLRVPEINQIAVTLGLSLLIQNLALVAFTADNRLITLPRSTESIELGPVLLQLPQLIAAGACLLLMLIVQQVLKRTDFGIMMRAVSQSRDGAVLSGINLTSVFRWSLCAGVGMLGVAGPLLTSVLYVNPSVGALFTLKAFVVVIAGGLGSFRGTIVGALLVGLTESVASLWLQASVAAAVPFFILILFLLLRPQGLLPVGGAR